MRGLCFFSELPLGCKVAESFCLFLIWTTAPVSSKVILAKDDAHYAEIMKDIESKSLLDSFFFYPPVLVSYEAEAVVVHDFFYELISILSLRRLQSEYRAIYVWQEGFVYLQVTVPTQKSTVWFSRIICGIP